MLAVHCTLLSSRAPRNLKRCDALTSVAHWLGFLCENRTQQWSAITFVFSFSKRDEKNVSATSEAYSWSRQRSDALVKESRPYTMSICHNKSLFASTNHCLLILVNTSTSQERSSNQCFTAGDGRRVKHTAHYLLRFRELVDCTSSKGRMNVGQPVCSMTGFARRTQLEAR